MTDDPQRQDPEEINPDLLRTRYVQILEERDRVAERCTRLEVALRDAIRNITRVRSRTVEVDPAGNTYELDWTDYVREWADLCHLDLTGMSLEAYEPPF